MIEVDLSKHQTLDPDPKTIQKINSTGNVDRGAGVACFPLLKKQSKMFEDFTRNYKSILILFFSSI